MRKGSETAGPLTPKQAHNTDNPKTEMMRYDRKVDDLRRNEDTPKNLDKTGW